MRIGYRVHTVYGLASSVRFMTECCISIKDLTAIILKSNAACKLFSVSVELSWPTGLACMSLIRSRVNVENCYRRRRYRGYMTTTLYI